MYLKTRIRPGAMRCAALALAFSAGLTLLHAQQPSSARTSNPEPSIAAAPSEADTTAIQDQLLKLMKTSPNLTMVVVRDPSLLADQDYVSRNNPELARFLQIHPEVARNPSYYLFTNLHPDRGRPDELLERKIWPDMGAPPRQDLPVLDWFSNTVGPFLVFITVAGVLIWLIRLLLENRRWGRIFKLQTEVHGKLIDRFASNQELLGYMGTEAGKRFLEAAPIPVDFDRGAPVPSAVARILTPLQIGIVLTLLGIGLILLRHSVADLEAPLLILGMVALMPGLGFIISAGITWLLAERLGLMPEHLASVRDSRLDQRERP